VSQTRKIHSVYAVVLKKLNENYNILKN